MESFKFSGMTIPELEEQLRQRDAQIKAQAAQLEEQAKRIEELEKANAELRKLFADMAKAKESKPLKEAMNYGVGRHEHKQRKKHRRKKSPGRKPKDGKADCATQTIDLYWYGADRKKWLYPGFPTELLMN